MAVMNDRSTVLDHRLILAIQNDDEQAIQQLFNKYKPAVNRVWSQYFITGFNRDDWYQEALIVMLKVTKTYNGDRGVSFGSFYRQALKNRFFDLLRKKNAQKRLPDNMVTSFNAYETYYADTIVDGRAVSPEQRLLMVEKLEAALKSLSSLERVIIMDLLENQSFKAVAGRHQCSEQRVINAYERCRRKFNDYRNETPC